MVENKKKSQINDQGSKGFWYARYPPLKKFSTGSLMWRRFVGEQMSFSELLVRFCLGQLQ